MNGGRCLKLAYLDRASAGEAKRRVMRQFGVATNPVFCEACKKFHLHSETWPPVRRWRDILVLIARGYRQREIANTLGMTRDSVSWAVYEMCRDWRALSQAHLITIVTSFGILDPEEFLLLDDELARFRPRDARKAEFTDVV